MSNGLSELNWPLLALCFLSCGRDFNEEPPKKTAATSAPSRELDASPAPSRELDASPAHGADDPDGAADATAPTTSDPTNGPLTLGDSGTEDSPSTDSGVRNGIQDWSRSFDAVYEFEDGAQQLGRDASGHGHDLEINGAPAASDEHVRGMFSALFEQPVDSTESNWEYLFTTNAFGRTTGSPSITFGAWLRSDSNGEYEVFANGDEVHGGFSMHVKLAARSLRCAIAGGLMANTSFGGEQVADFTEWHHVACRYHDDTKLAQYFVDGVGLPPEQDAPAGLAEGRGGLRVAKGFNGQLDEVFFIKRALTDAQVARIRICGVDGSACSCSATKPAAYETCGPLGNCSVAPLPACNSVLDP